MKGNFIIKTFVSGAVTSLGCTDCKTNFSSASLLLKHFAEHISSNAAREGSAESESDDTRSESILERALRSPASASGSSVHEARSPATASDEAKKPDDEHTNQVRVSNAEAKMPILFELAKGSNHINNNNNNNNKHVMYVKLDLQKRVENCVLQLTGSSESTDEDSIKQESPEEGVAEAEEFNPLKFCVVTLEEGSEKIELNDPPRKACMNPCNGQTDPQQQYKKYVCTYCFKRFGWSTDLKRHILTHTGERPFQCQLCGATFTRNFLLQKHVVKLHKPPPEQTDGTAPTTSPDPPSGAAAPEVKLEPLSDSEQTLKDPNGILSKRRRHGILADGNKT